MRETDVTAFRAKRAAFDAHCAEMFDTGQKLLARKALLVGSPSPYDETTRPSCAENSLAPPMEGCRTVTNEL